MSLREAFTALSLQGNQSFEEVEMSTRNSLLPEIVTVLLEGAAEIDASSQLLERWIPFATRQELRMIG
jgi:hypothetical protein